MAHRLVPKDGKSHLSPDDIWGRIRNEFGFVESSESKAKWSVIEQVVLCYGDKLKGSEIVTMELFDYLFASYFDSFKVTIAHAKDAPEHRVLSFTVERNEGILLGYWGAQHEDGTQDLRKRLANVLGYNIELV